MLRTIFVLVVAAIGTAFACTGPFNGLLYYMWVAHFRPESWVWSDLIQNLNLSLIAGILTLVTSVLGQARFRFDLRAGLLLAFGIQCLVSTAISPYFTDCWPFFFEFAKVLVIVYLIPVLATDVHKLRRILLVIGLSLGAEGAKQGWATLILLPGSQNMNTIAHLGDNNAVAIGMLVVVALMVVLSSTAAGAWERRFYLFMAVGASYRCLSTYSRGGLLAFVAMGLWYLARSKHRLFAIASVVLAGVLILPVLPTGYWDRMNTMNTAREDLDNADSSILGRLHFWEVAMQMANDRPLTGVGHGAFNLAYDKYDPSNGLYGSHRAVHSTWFGALAELGYPGFVLFVAIVIASFAGCFKARRAAARGAPKVLETYAFGVEMSLVAFLVGGSFLIFQYNELLWHLIGLSTAVQALAVAVPAASSEPQIETSGLATGLGTETMTWNRA